MDKPQTAECRHCGQRGICQECGLTIDECNKIALARINGNPKITNTAEGYLLENLERLRKELQQRNYEKAGVSLDCVIGAFIDYFTFKEIATAK
jgi:hypothetical protein